MRSPKLWSSKCQLKYVLPTIIIIPLLTACAADRGQTNPNESAVDRANANFGTTVATGAITGAAAGALLGALFDHGNPAAGAALGGLAGGALGAGAGTVVANNNVNQARTEGTLQDQIQAAQQIADQANNAAAEAQQREAAAADQARQLAAQYNSGQITMAQYKSQLASSQQYDQGVQNLIKNLNGTEVSLNQQIAAAGSSAGPLQASLAQIDSSKQSLQRSQDEFISATSAVPGV